MDPATGNDHRVAAVIDDSRHVVLGRARALAQTGIEAFGDDAAGPVTLPRTTFGHYNVREMEAREALTLCRMPGEPWSLNPYVGCSHACTYCYVPDVARMERDRWGTYTIVKRNLPNLLARELKRKERREVFLSSATDPYQPAEGEHRITRRCLEVLVRADWPLRVLTRNPLVRRDVDLFHRFTDCEVGMSVPTLDDAARRLLEPGAPTVDGRLRALRGLADAGLAPTVNMAPCYPLTGDITPAYIAEAFREAGVREVHAWPWRYLEGVLPALRKRLADLPPDAASDPAYARFEEAVRDPAYFTRLFRSLHAAFRAAGVPLHA